MIMLPDPLRLILAALALYRLAQFISLDDGPFNIFRRFRHWTDEKKLIEVSRETKNGPWGFVDGLARCPFCQQPWIAAGVVALLIWPSVGGDVFLLWMGLTGAAAFLQGQTP